MLNKGSVLYYSILFYIFFTTSLSNIMIRLHFAYFESKNYISMEEFSYIESYVLQKTIQAFRKEKLKPFSLTSKLGDIEVRMDDEIAWIFYNFETKRYARLDYDLVFDTSMSYVYLEEGEFSFVDKVAD